MFLMMIRKIEYSFSSSKTHQCLDSIVSCVSAVRLVMHRHWRRHVNSNRCLQRLLEREVEGTYGPGLVFPKMQATVLFWLDV
jgi:hypothetical protein